MKLSNMIAGLLLLPSCSYALESEVKSFGLFVEPFATYELGTTSVDYPSPLSNSSGDVDGFGIGGRFGFHFSEALFVALDARYAMPQFKDSSVNYDSASISTNWGPVVGLQMPNYGMRVWGAWIADGSLDPERSGSFDVEFKDASGYRIGAGFHINQLSLNLEYQQLSYNETQLEQLGPFSPGSSFNSVELDANSWVASLSFPIEL